MPYYRRKRRLYRIRDQLLRAGWVLVGLIALGGLWWWLANLGPREIQVSANKPIAETRDPESAELAAEIERLRQELAEADESEALLLLDETIARQREWVGQGHASQADLRDLTAMEQQRDSIRAEQINAQIEQLEDQAETARQAGDLVATEAAWREALRLQETVNRSGADIPRKNFVRESGLQRRLQELAAAPLAEEVASARAIAETAMGEERWADALAALTAARESQQRINAEYARSDFADLQALDQIERDIESLDAGGIAAEVNEQEAAGDAALAASDYALAVASFEAARQAQLRLNREFGRSRFLSSPRVEQLEVKRQTASSMPLLAGLRKDAAVIDGLLLRREVGAAAERILVAAAQLEEVFAQLPKSESLDDDLRLKLGYLATQVDRLGEIQDTVYERLRPLPGVAERRLFKTEFPQSLYLQVMRINPSRNPGRAFPVDSVNWVEATTCCQRLSWILSRSVRLPTADEFRIAVGNPTSNFPRERTEGSNSRTSLPMADSPANPGGFYDLLGNVAEWLQPASDPTGLWALTGGGSFLDETAELQRVPVRKVQRNERARHVGFRVVVEFDDG